MPRRSLQESEAATMAAHARSGAGAAVGSDTAGWKIGLGAAAAALAVAAVAICALLVWRRRRARRAQQSKQKVPVLASTVSDSARVRSLQTVATSNCGAGAPSDPDLHRHDAVQR